MLIVIIDIVLYAGTIGLLNITTKEIFKTVRPNRNLFAYEQ